MTAGVGKFRYTQGKLTSTSQLASAKCQLALLYSVRMLKKLFCLLLLLIPIGLPLLVSGKDKDHDVAYEALQRGQILPLSKILSQTATQVSGEVIKVELDSKRLEYKLKVLSANGQVRKVRVDARNGTLLSIKDDD